jgi:DNA-binding NarL/FixJ family response regulator
VSGGSVRVAIADPLPLFRTGIAAALRVEGYPVSEPEDLLEWSAGGEPALVVIGLTTAVQWHLLSDLGRERPAVRTVALLNDEAAASRAVLSGAAAVLPRGVSAAHLRDACRAVLRGECMLPAAVVRDLLRRVARWDDEVRLADHELRWLRDLAQGHTVATVAAQAGYSERMMFRLLRDLYAKLGVANRTEAMLLAREHGWM